jgi:hypothetical protein
MSETISKLEPHRTIYLQGFGRTSGDGYGCVAALSQASASGFTLSGEFVAQDDFVVLVLWDADGGSIDGITAHPRIGYLPDWAFDGVVLQFTLQVTNCMPIDAAWYPVVTWPYLMVEFADGTQQQVPLLPNATAAAGSYVQPAATFTLGGSLAAGDVIGLCWLNYSYSYTLTVKDTLASAVAGLAAAIGGAASASGASITITLPASIAQGANGNFVGAYGTVTGDGAWTPAAAYFNGGQSPTAWTITIDFSSLNETTIQRMWLTFAPAMQNQQFTQEEFSAVFTNWTLTDPNGRLPLSVAGPGSVRIQQSDSWCSYTGYWEAAPTALGWWSMGAAVVAAYNAGDPLAAVTIQTSCQSPCDLYVGTRLDWNCGILSATLDGGAPITLDTYGSGVNVRRLLFANVAAGAHTVVLTVTSNKNANSQGWYFYFNFLECAVPGEVPDAPATDTAFGVATDWDTNSSIYVSPERLVWAIQKLGLVGEIDHYTGVFWWGRKSDPAHVYTTWTIVFSGTLPVGDYVYLNLGGTEIGHATLIGDTLETLATCFALLVSQGTAAFFATASGATLTLTQRSEGPDYALTVACNTSCSPGLAAAVTNNVGSGAWTFGLDATLTPELNRAARDWHSDYFAQLAAAGIGVTVAFSQELVRPPDNPPSAVWIQRFPDGTPVTTATGYSDLNSSQIAWGAAVQAYLAKAYIEMGTLMGEAGLPVRLQFGEVGWWFDADASGMAYYDTDTAAAAETTLGRPLHTFLTPNDDPSVNSYADANFLRARLQAFVAAVQAAVVAALATAVFELLWPLDVNDPTVAQLNYYVNLPSQWQQRAGSGFADFLIEGLSYGGVEYNVTKAQWCAGYPFQVLGWDLAHCRYMLSWFYPACPWVKEYWNALATGVPLIKAWAWDHLNLYGWPVLLLPETASVQVFAL